MKSRVMIFLGATMMAAFLAWSAPAGTLHGIVTDPSGAVIPAASVSVSGPHFVREVETDETGQYEIAGLPPGHYTVQIHSVGFAPLQRSGLVLSAGYETEADAQLAIQSSKQEITVTD
jgi:hypothetical protein